MTTTEETVQFHETRIGLLESIAERQQKLLEEVQQDSKYYRRIWIAIAKKQQLFNDDEWQDVFGDGQ